MTPPWYGSFVAWKRSTGGSPELATFTGFRVFVGQNAHGALYQALFQAMKGAFWAATALGRLEATNPASTRRQREAAFTGPGPDGGTRAAVREVPASAGTAVTAPARTTVAPHSTTALLRRKAHLPPQEARLNAFQ